MKLKDDIFKANCPHQNRQVCPQQICDEDRWHDDGVTHEGSDGDELVAVAADLEGVTVAPEAEQDQANHNQDLGTKLRVVLIFNDFNLFAMAFLLIFLGC